MADADTLASFPTYADLTQTQGWARDATVPVQLPASASAESQRYAERAVLGAGGMGKVLLAHDARINREVAVKQLHAERELAPEERARFLREAMVQGQLEHPSIVPVYDIETRADGTTFFTMRRVVGRTLHAILEELRRGDPKARAEYTTHKLLTAFATMCLTIDYAHSRGVIHRDLKPANTMFGDFGEVYVLDWGLARLVGESAQAVGADDAGRLSMPGELMGTPLYMAPEQMHDPAVGVAADVFSLGAILFEILTLQTLRDPQSVYVPPDARPGVRAPSRTIAPELETICVRATDADPDARFPTARALHDAVVRYLEGDRELAQRTQLATEHAARAREALARAEQPGSDYERERQAAIEAMRNALGLEPTNAEHYALLGQIMATPPSTIPPEVQAELRAETERVVRSGARYSVLGMASWFAFLPVLISIGVLDWTYTSLAVGFAGASALCSLVAARQRVVSRVLQIVVAVTTLIAAMMLSRLYGPLIVMPTLIASYAIVLQAHPWGMYRRFGAIAGVTAMMLPFLLEQAGVLPASYAFEHGVWLIRPQAVALAANTQWFIALMHLAMIVVPCVFIAKLRSELSEVQARHLVQAWHYRRLAGKAV
ncbi:MAG TPA: serine/threonine-protein kinase [Kofleriaceae bacterium]|nr:serine/threonine-protein kinase [Kofleriaceae bacterium]